MANTERKPSSAARVISFHESKSDAGRNLLEAREAQPKELKPRITPDGRVFRDADQLLRDLSAWDDERFDRAPRAQTLVQHAATRTRSKHLPE